MTVQQLYDDAYAALHRLLTGRSVREVVDQNGERVTYTTANLSALQNYVMRLAKELGITPPGLPRANGPMGFFF